MRACAKSIEKLNVTRSAPTSSRASIIDLRNNRGDRLDQPVLVSDAFLERGKIVSTRQVATAEETQVFNAKAEADPRPRPARPSWLLINGSSASAAEMSPAPCRTTSAPP